MSDGSPSPNRAWGPHGIEAMIGAYRAILQEICETGSLACLLDAPMAARDVRRLIARQVIDTAAIGVRTQQDLVTLTLARLARTRMATA